MERLLDAKLDNRILDCIECGGEFTFSPGEQLYFTSKKLSTPKRCKRCRLERRLNLVPDRGDL